MNNKIYFCIFFIILCFISNIDTIYPKTIFDEPAENFIKYAAGHLSSNDSTTDTSKTNSTLLQKYPLKYSQSQFTYADNYRTTITGDLPLINSDIKPVPTLIAAGVLGSIFVVQHIMQQNTIWKEVGEFHFAEDIEYALWVDKLGHFYGTYSVSYLLSEALMPMGFSWESATILASGLGLAYTTYVEILDGFSKNFGFSPSDFYSDAAGALYFSAQYFIPFLQNFTPKFMFVNPPWLGEHKRMEAESFIDDYSSQTFWLSLNIHNMLPESLKNYWPKWLELCFGYAAYSLCSKGSAEACYPGTEKVNNSTYGNRRFIVSFDYNLQEILPDGAPFWNWFKQSLRHFKLPAPALEFGSTTKFYILYPFQINF